MKHIRLKNPDYEQLVSVFRQYMEAMHYSPSALNQEPPAAVEFLSFLEAGNITDIRQVSYNTILSFVNYLQKRRNTRHPERHLSIYQQVRIMGGVRNLFCYLVRTGRLSSNPASDVVIRKPKRLPRNIMSRKEVEAMLNCMETETAQGIRNRLILELLYGTGLRRQEVVSVNIQDVDLAENTINVREGKGRKDRFVPMSPTLRYWMEKYLRESRTSYLFKVRCVRTSYRRAEKPHFPRPVNENALFLNYRGEAMGPQTVMDIVRQAFNKAKIKMHSLLNKHITPHCFRHTIATHLIKKGIDIRRIQKMLGHASLESTMIYTHVDIEDLKEIAKKNHPREHHADLHE